MSERRLSMTTNQYDPAETKRVIEEAEKYSEDSYLWSTVPGLMTVATDMLAALKAAVREIERLNNMIIKAGMGL